MKKEQCFHPPDREGKSNCWAYKYRSEFIDLGAQWIRKKYALNLNFELPKWMLYDDENTPSYSCNGVRNYLNTYDHSIAMSENWLPDTGLCIHDFLNIMIFRHPLERLRSHYRHIYDTCTRRSNHPELCSRMITDGKYFDVDIMRNAFDIVTDNYYVRSLNDQHVYSSSIGSLRQSQLNSARENLRNFDWILLLGPEYDNSTKEILQEGIGLSDGLPKSRQVGKEEKIFDFRPTDWKGLEKMNELDLELWNEAKRLHRLDLLSIRKMKSVSPQSWYQRFNVTSKNTKSCCGVICGKFRKH